MLASFFIANGVKALKNPDALVPAAEPIAEKFVPFAQRALPEAVSAYVPEDTRSLVRLNGLLAIVGGMGVATGIAPRGGAALAATSMVPHVIASNPLGASDKAAATSIFVRNVALLGAAIVLTQDTHGKPGLTWRANDSASRLGRRASHAVDGVQSEAEKLGRRAQKRLDRAAKDAGRRLDVVIGDYDKLSDQARRRFDRANAAVQHRLQEATASVKGALQ